MIDLGELVNTVQAAVAGECGGLDEYVGELLGAVLPDADNLGSEKFLIVWENMLDITSPPTNFNERINIVKARLNALGSPNIAWFITLAERLGWTYYEFGQSIPGGVKHIHIRDGLTLAFRAGLNATGDIVYDNIIYTSLTIFVDYKSQGAILDNALIQTFLFIRSQGTTILFNEIIGKELR
jgi:hypothetical protein